MPSKKSEGNKFLTNVLQAVVISLTLGILGAAWKTYMAVHDMNTRLTGIERRLKTIQGKQDWLYHYDFPNMDEDDGR